MSYAQPQPPFLPLIVLVGVTALFVTCSQIQDVGPQFKKKRYRLHTQGWLLVHAVCNIYTRVRMRPDDDHRPDYELKADWLKDGKPDLVFEDRKQVVDMYRSHGILVAQVAEGNY